jgi:hypothetical protein
VRIRRCVLRHDGAGYASWKRASGRHLWRTMSRFAPPRFDPFTEKSADTRTARARTDTFPNSPENSSASDDDRVIIVGATGNTAQIVKLDRDGAKLFGSSYTLANALSGSVAALGGDRYIGGWYTSTSACIVRVFDGALATTAMLDLAEPCRNLRVASNGSRVGLAWRTGASIVQAMTGDPALSTMSPVVNLMAIPLGSPRITSTTDGFWVRPSVAPGGTLRRGRSSRGQPPLRGGIVRCTSWS